MATTNTPLYDSKGGSNFSGFYPTDGRTGIYTSEVTDEAGLDALNDIVNQMIIAKGCRIVDIWGRLGDFDTGSAITMSVFVNDGTAREVIKDITTPRAGGGLRLYTDGSSGANYTNVGVELTAAATIYVQTTAAPTGAQTSGRLVSLSVLVEAVS